MIDFIKLNQHLDSVVFLVLFSLCSTANAFDTLYEEIPIALTPTRLKQPLADTPASVTIIDRKMIKSVGARDIVDALRLVPGLVTQVSKGHTINVSFHSGNGGVPRRLLILIDGVPTYGPGIANIDWPLFPVAIENIERIEVTRSPNTAAYGNNAFNGVINITTQHPGDEPGYLLRHAQGSQAAKDTLLKYSGELGANTIRVSLSQQQDSGVDIPEEDPPEFHDDRKIRRISAQLSRDISDKASFGFSIIDNKGKLEDEGEVNRPEENLEDELTRQLTFQDIDRKRQIVSGRVLYEHSESNNWKVIASRYSVEQKQEFQSCAIGALYLQEFDDLLQINPELISSLTQGTPPTPSTPQEAGALLNFIQAIGQLGGFERALQSFCGDINFNFDETRNLLEIQNIFSFSETLRIVSALGYSKSKINSETFFQGEVETGTNSFLTNIEYKPNSNFTFNVGGIWEDDDNVGTEFSPRLAINYHFNTQNTLRFIHSKAVRTPDLLEQKLLFLHQVRNLNMPINDQNSAPLLGLQLASPGDLESEHITANEISFYSNLDHIGLDLDLKLFKEKLENLISEKFVLDQIEFSNNDSSEIKGLELELNYHTSDKFRARLGYTYFDTETSNKVERDIAMKETILGFIAYQVSPQWQVNSSYQYLEVDSLNPLTPPYEHVDLVVLSDHKLFTNLQLETSFRVRHYLNNHDFDSRQHYDRDTHFHLGLTLRGYF